MKAMKLKTIELTKAKVPLYIMHYGTRYNYYSFVPDYDVVAAHIHSFANVRQIMDMVEAQGYKRLYINLEIHGNPVGWVIYTAKPTKYAG